MTKKGRWSTRPWTCFGGIALCAQLSTGCVASVGPVASRTVDASPTVTSGGGRLTGVLHPSGRDRGLALGGEVETSWRLDEEGEFGSDFSRTRALIGYADSPLPYRALPIGIDAFAVAGFGSHPYEGRSARALSLGPRIGIPIRFTKQRPLWKEEKKADVTHMLLPTFDWTFFLPVGNDVSHTIRSEATVGIAYRAHIWTALLP